jgi:hypothetical protein
LEAEWYFVASAAAAAVATAQNRDYGEKFGGRRFFGSFVIELPAEVVGRSLKTTFDYLVGLSAARSTVAPSACLFRIRTKSRFSLSSPSPWPRLHSSRR